jgi:citronellyl-CoA synthetase
MQDLAAELAYLEENRHRYSNLTRDETATLFSLTDAQAEIRPDALMVVTNKGSITWGEFQKLSWRIAQSLRSRGVQRADAVALNMENDILFLACTIAITRLGAVVGLINTNLAGRQLVHCVRETGAKLSVVGNAGLAAALNAWDDYKDLGGKHELVWFDVGDQADEPPDWVVRGADLAECAQEAPPLVTPPVRARDPAMFVFTSGTTGLPKAAIVRHGKAVFGAAGMAVLAFRATPEDRLYNCLPLYHGTGLMVGAAACMFSGASMFLRRKFSASALIDEANEHGCTMLVYIGEICRYLMHTPERANDDACAIVRAAGNGLRPDIWRAFKTRFGIERIGEFYGASEANGGFINVLNKDETIGITGSTVRLVHYHQDDATIVRDETGRASAAAPGETGLLLIAVDETSPYDGYTNAAHSETKLVRDVFQPGDCWYNSGDLMREVDVGEAFGLVHYQFVDRLGDTFRWKSENVAASEVAEALCGSPEVELACVYGVMVPGADGRAGMAAITPATPDGPDLARLSDHIEATLPRYARPLFLRIANTLDMTGTHKIVKTRYMQEGYDITSTDDAIFSWNPAERAYRRLDAHRLSEIAAGRSGY